MKKFQYLWEDLNTSFWFIPVMMLMLVTGLAMALIYLDSQISYSPEGVLKYLLPASIDSARSILVIIGGAMIGVAGTVFSITLVVLTLASSQLGSRLVRNFMYDKLNQFVLGAYVSSFVYCLIVLSSIKENTDFHFVPAISVLVALISAIAGKMDTISTFARNKNQQELIVQHAEMIMNIAKKTFSEKRDLKDMKDRYEALKEKKLQDE